MDGTGLCKLYKLISIRIYYPHVRECLAAEEMKLIHEIRHVQSNSSSQTVTVLHGEDDQAQLRLLELLRIFESAGNNTWWLTSCFSSWCDVVMMIWKARK